jgi:hypothetical protein
MLRHVRGKELAGKFIHRGEESNCDCGTAAKERKPV